MDDWAFWRLWRKPHRWSYYVLGLLFGGSVVFLGMAWLISPESRLGWLPEGTTQVRPVVVDTFTKDFFTFRVDVDAYLIQHIFQVPDWPDTRWGAYLATGLWWVAWVFLLSAITYIRKILWFAFSMVGGLSFLLMAQFSEMSAPLDAVQGGDPDQYFLMVSLVLILGLSYVFQGFLTRSSLIARLLAFGGLTAALGYYFVMDYARVDDPIFALGNFMLLGPLILSLVFVVFNAHEIPHTLTYFITNTGRQGNNLRHFVIAIAFYLFNLGYGFAVSIRAASADILYLSPYLIYLLSTCLGIWGFSKRRDRVGHILNFDPFGAVLYLALAVISNATLAYALLTDNNPILEVFEDVILFAHIGMGIAFLGYVFINFGNQLQSSLPIYRVIWNPRQLDYVFFVGLGLLIMGIFGLRTDFFPRYQAVAGQNNAVAAVFAQEGLPFLSQKYYETSLGYDYQSHHANYALAQQYMADENYEKALFYFEQALLKTPLPQTYFQKAQAHLRLDQFQDAVWSLEAGLERFPLSGELRNNLALLYQQSGRSEDALTFLQAALPHTAAADVVEANYFALLSGAENIPDPFPTPERTTSALVLSNAHVGNIRRNEASPVPFQPQLLTDSVLQTPELCYLYHHVIGGLNAIEDSAWADRLIAYANIPQNSEQRLFLETAAALRYYANGQTQSALTYMENLHYREGQMSSVFANVLGYWMLAHGQYRRAAEYFAQAIQQGHSTGHLARALALSEEPYQSAARLVWQVWSLQDQNPYQGLAQEMLQVWDWDKTQVPPQDWTTNNQYRLLYYFADTLTDAVFDAVLDRLSDNPDLLIRALAKRIHAQLDAGKVAAAQKTFETLENILPVLPESLPIQQDALLRVLTKTQQWDKVAERLPDFQPTLRGRQTLYKAQLAIHRRDSTQAAHLVERALQELPLEPEVYHLATQYYAQTQQPNAAYRVALAGHQYLPQDMDLYQNYALQALQSGFERYADEARRQLRQRLSPESYQTFNQKYETIQAELEAKAEAWLLGED